jgi:hypothetical protein
LPGRHDQTALEHVEVIVNHSMQDPSIERERRLQTRLAAGVDHPQSRFGDDIEVEAAAHLEGD